MKKKRKMKRTYTKINDSKRDCTYYSGTYARVYEEAKQRKYRFIKSYRYFVLLERLDNGCKECFLHNEYNQLEVI